jgi:hypothetical protein
MPCGPQIARPQLELSSCHCNFLPSSDEELNYTVSELLNTDRLAFSFQVK